MATIDWPARLVPQAAQLSLRKAGAQFSSPLNGTLQAVDYIGERWTLSASLAAQQVRDPNGVHAFCNRLAGGIERVRVWAFHTGGLPRGTLRGAPVLSAGVSRGASALPITSAGHAINLLQFPEDLRNSAEAGSTRPWTQFLDADAGVVLETGFGMPFTSSTTFGQFSRFELSTPGVANRQVQQNFSVPDNAQVTASVFAKIAQVPALRIFGATKNDLYPSALFRLDAGVASGPFADGAATLSGYGVQPAGNGWLRCWISWNVLSGGTPVSAMICQLNNTAGTAYGGAVSDGMLLWGAQVEYGSSPSPYTGHPTILQGDFLGCGGHLFQVAADTTLVNGAASVPVINRARGPIASNSPVVWYRPTCDMVLPAMQAGPVHRPGLIDSTALDLVEVW